VILLRQYRHAVGGYLWEVPAGTLDPDETPAECAARELAEEAGFTAQLLEPAGSIVTCPGFCDEVIHIFIATGLTPVTQTLAADEVIDGVRALLLSDALSMVAAGEIRDAKTVAALMKADLRDRSSAEGGGGSDQ
jgi:ADP-ribose pyrophosphatase